MTDAVYKSVIIFIIMNFVLFLIIIIASGIDTTKGRGFLYKKICDIIVIIFQYLILISMYPVINFVNEYIGRWTIIVTLVNIVYIFKLGCSQLLFEYSCAMKSHFRKSGNQMTGKWKSSYASLLA